MEQYLGILRSPEHRKSITRLRISAHGLNIERGRYQGTPRSSRTCLRCNSGEVDDEKHFLLSCKHLEDKRNKMLNTTISKCSNFIKLKPDEKLIWLMNTENIEVLTQMCDLIKESKI